MAQQVRVPATKPEDPSLIPVEGENRFPSHALTSSQVPCVFACTHTHIYKSVLKKDLVKLAVRHVHVCTVTHANVCM